VLAAVFLGSQFIGRSTVLERVLGSQLTLSRLIWTRLNVLWIGNFTLVGALNLFVAYRFEEAVWVSYKLYSSIGFTLALMLLTVAIVAPHVKDDGEQPEGSQ
jgi:intracellular septation protein